MMHDFWQEGIDPGTTGNPRGYFIGESVEGKKAKADLAANQQQSADMYRISQSLEHIAEALSGRVDQIDRIDDCLHNMMREQKLSNQRTQIETAETERLRHMDAAWAAAEDPHDTEHTPSSKPTMAAYNEACRATPAPWPSYAVFCSPKLLRQWQRMQRRPE